MTDKEKLNENKPLTLREILVLPMEKRRKLLREQANDPAVIDYYKMLDKQAQEDIKMME